MMISNSAHRPLTKTAAWNGIERAGNWIFRIIPAHTTFERTIGSLLFRVKEVRLKAGSMPAGSNLHLEDVANERTNVRMVAYLMSSCPDSRVSAIKMAVQMRPSLMPRAGAAIGFPEIVLYTSAAEAKRITPMTIMKPS